MPKFIAFLIYCTCLSGLEAVIERSEHLKILSTQERNEGGLIVAMTEKGLQKTQITTGPNDWQPIWLGSKNTILFLSDLNVSEKVTPEEDDPFYQPKAHLYIQEIGGLARQLTFGDHKVWLPESSPDGKFVAFLSDKDGSSGDLYILEVATGSIERVTTKKEWPMECAIWLSSNQLLFNMFIEDTLEMYVFDLKSKHLKQITHSVPCTKNGYSSISPDLKHIAFVSRDRNADDALETINPQIFIMDIDGKNRRQLTHDGFINFMPSWSPNSQQIIFLREQVIDGKIDHQLRIIDKAGIDEHQLTDEPLLSNPKWIPGTSVVIYITQIDGHRKIRGLDLTTKRSYTISKDEYNYSEPAVRPIWTN